MKILIMKFFNIVSGALHFCSTLSKMLLTAVNYSNLNPCSTINELCCSFLRKIWTRSPETLVAVSSVSGAETSGPVEASSRESNNVVTNSSVGNLQRVAILRENTVINKISSIFWKSLWLCSHCGSNIKCHYFFITFYNQSC